MEPGYCWRNCVARDSADARCPPPVSLDRNNILRGGVGDDVVAGVVVAVGVVLLVVSISFSFSGSASCGESSSGVELDALSSVSSSLE